MVFNVSLFLTRRTCGQRQRRWSRWWWHRRQHWLPSRLYLHISTAMRYYTDESRKSILYCF